MSFRTWREAVESLTTATELTTPKQQELGRLADIEVSPNMPRIVAGATLRTALAGELNLPAPHPVSDRQKFRLEILQRSSDTPILPQCDEEAEAWVTYLRLVQRREHLLRLEINEGDVIETKAGEIAEVSSVGQDGRVFFKGGQGFSSWPDLITSVLARRDEISDSATEIRRQAKNSAARHAASSEWSIAKSRDLAEFIIESRVSESDIAELERVISLAEDERDIQRFLEENPNLLTALLEGNERYCVPQKRLGAEYVPDFIIGDVNSLGFRWVLVELETPKSGIYLKSGLSLGKNARNGVDQIVNWRKWLSDNISYARQRRSENGLGLFDINESADALVLVGRRSQVPETKDAQRKEYYRSGIRIHSYDWLLGALYGIIKHQGPPGYNPYLLSRAQSDSL